MLAGRRPGPLVPAPGSEGAPGGRRCCASAAAAVSSRVLGKREPGITPLKTEVSRACSAIERAGVAELEGRKTRGHTAGIFTALTLRARVERGGAQRSAARPSNNSDNSSSKGSNGKGKKKKKNKGKGKKKK